jgi:hypothetical protein
MRWNNLLIVANYVLFLVACLFALGFQSSLWLKTLGSTPAPQLWIPFLVYFSLYRHRIESFFGVYLLAAATSAFSAFPFGLVVTTQLLMAVGIQTFKERIFWSGAGFFALMVSGASALSPFALLIVSWIFDKNPIREFQIFNTLVSTLLTTLSSFPLYQFFSFIDRWTQKELPTETGTQML